LKTNINYHGVELTVEYVYDVKYYPATREQPEEYPEMEILKITVDYGKTDIKDMLHWKAMEEIQSLIDA
jgi:hypothetical protein